MEKEGKYEEIIKYIEILENEKLNLPAIQKIEKENFEFIDWIKKNLSNFQGLIEHYSFFLPKDLKFIKEEIDFINNIVKSYFVGQIPTAYDDFGKLFDKIHLVFNKNQKFMTDLQNYIFFSTQDHGPKYSEYLYKTKKLYRGRKSTNPLQKLTSKSKFFHPPFNKRYFLKDERFSISGHPSLYLGESSYLCWVELDRPPLDEFSIVKYTFNSKDFTFYDLSWRPWTLAQTLRIIKNHDENSYKISKSKDSLEYFFKQTHSIREYLKLWPFLFMCSIQVKNRGKNQNFFPEYIFPQFFLQTINSKFPNGLEKGKRLGIKYFSMKRKYKNDFGNIMASIHGDLMSINYAISVNELLDEELEIDTDKYSKIIEKFHISDPISHQEIQILSTQQVEKPKNFLHYKDVTLENLVHLNYESNIFGKMEMLLDVNHLSYQTREGVYIHNWTEKSLTMEELETYLYNEGYTPIKKTSTGIPRMAKYIISSDIDVFINENISNFKYLIKPTSPKSLCIEDDQQQIYNVEILTEKECLLQLLNLKFLFD